MTPLILRPRPQADELAEALSRAGHTPVVTPLLTITPGGDLPTLPRELAWADLVIAVSAHAIPPAHARLAAAGLAWPACPLLAVGAATAAAWAQVGQIAAYPQDARSEGILALPALQDVAGRHILILRGNGGREWLARQLRERGALVHYCECYQRLYPSLDGTALWAGWRTAGIDSVIITSGELFTRLMELMPAEARPWLATLTFIVPSDRVAALVMNAGLTRIQIAAGASHMAMVAVAGKRKHT